MNLVGANSHSAEDILKLLFSKGQSGHKGRVRVLVELSVFDLLNPECAKQVFSLLQVGAWSKKVSV
jgi:hypothetical protein